MSKYQLFAVAVLSTATLFGPRPDVGDLPHHYEFTLISIDLEPFALEPGLSHTDLLAALQDHALGTTSIVGRYAR